MIFTVPKLVAKEREVIERIDAVRTSLRYAVSQERRWTGLLRRSAFARAIRGSNSIEGYDVTVDDAIAAAEGQEPLTASVATWQAITGYRNAMTYVLQLADDPHFTYSAGLLRSLHYMMLQYDLAKSPGRWRPGLIYVRNDDRGDVVYEGPDAERVAGLMDELIGWLNTGDTDAPAMVRAGMAHLNLVMIHPFMDGNGRMGRCLQTLVLAREGILAPQFSSVEEYLGRNTHEYYAVLAHVGSGQWHPERDARPWMRFMLTAHFRQASTLLSRTRETQRMFDTLEREVTQRGLPERTVLALVDAAWGYRVRRATYRPAADIADNLASRDLKQLVDAGLLVAHGEKRGRSYAASPMLTSLAARLREPRQVEDPFAAATGG